MTTHHQSDSVTSSPRSDHPPVPSHKWHDSLQPRVRFMCSFGGRILPRPKDNQLRYVGGETRIVAVHRSTTFSALLSKLSKLSATTEDITTVKYQLPNEELDALISVTTDEDVENMIEEYDRLLTQEGVNIKTARLRLFLFPLGSGSGSRATSISSLLDGSSKREHWFLDALNGGGSASLERGRSEVSSIVSEMPDYLFGLDNSEDPKTKTRFAENVSVASDPGSPFPTQAMPSPYCSVSSATVAEGTKEDRIEVEAVAMGYPGNPTWHYVPESHMQVPPVQPVPVYYMQAAGNVPVRQVPLPMPYVQRVPQLPAQMFQQQVVPVGQNNGVSVGQMYASPIEMKPVQGGESYDYQTGVISDGLTQQVYYGPRNPVFILDYDSSQDDQGGDLDNF
ncbi:uncharacterized protein LOC143892995 [Tasmannia lanceolata]|uniref:uncharacterized protein LOC143892995 n=1 Tax=Tasmannia lanceolata TaxID=3420 RepID=UPI004062B037